ncbi:hypothetical protein D9M68_505200 [compost metagenome]
MPELPDGEFVDSGQEFFQPGYRVLRQDIERLPQRLQAGTSRVMIVLQAVQETAVLRGSLAQFAIQVDLFLGVMQTFREGIDVEQHCAQQANIGRLSGHACLLNHFL